MEVQVHYLDHYPRECGELRYAHDGDSGVDLRAALCADTPVLIEPGKTAFIPSGVKMEVPAGFEIQVRPRSGLALKHGITVLNTPGTVDSGYRGEIGIILINHSHEPFTVTRGDRIAQAVVGAVERAVFKVAVELSETTRGEGGFNSTGCR